MPNDNRHRTVTAAELTFGVEIECYLPRNSEIRVGGYHAGQPLPGEFGRGGWKAENDASIRIPNAHDWKRCEVVSPVLVGEAGLKGLVDVLAYLRGQGARVNASCGFHVHVGVDPERGEELSRIVCLVARHQAALYAITGTKTRENGLDGQVYADKIKHRVEFDQFKGGKAVGRWSLPCDRYCLLNLTNLRINRRPTVEFRVFSGTTNTTKAVTFVRVALGLVQQAINMKRAARWDIAHKAVATRGDGQNAARHLLGELGWVGVYRADRVAGQLDCDGAPDRAACVAEATRLAAKYDGPEDDQEVA